MIPFFKNFFFLNFVSSIWTLSNCYRDNESDRAVEEVLAAKGKQQKELLGNLLEDEKYQRDAFAALFVKQDQTTRQICSQVESIQNELASLSMVEMTKKDLKVSAFLFFKALEKGANGFRD